MRVSEQATNGGLRTRVA